MKTNKIFISAFALSIAFTSLTSCSSDSNSSLPPIGGYASADEVGMADLVAYFPLNGNGNESISGTAPSGTVNTTFEAGVKGQGAKMASGYIKYPSIAALAAINGSITTSCWVKISNTKLIADGNSTISPLISLTGGTNTNIGNLSLFGNTHGLVSSDSIQMKAEYHFKMPDGTSSFNGDCVNVTKASTDPADAAWTPAANKIGGQWAHIVWVWDGSTGTTRMYANGVKISNAPWESRNNGAAMPFSLFTPTFPILGATPSVADGTNVETWNAALKGNIDEVRIWKKALNQADINALYELEKAGR